MQMSQLTATRLSAVFHCISLVPYNNAWNIDYISLLFRIGGSEGIFNFKQSSNTASKCYNENGRVFYTRHFVLNQQFSEHVKPWCTSNSKHAGVYYDSYLNFSVYWSCQIHTDYPSWILMLTAEIHMPTYLYLYLTLSVRRTAAVTGRYCKHWTTVWHTCTWVVYLQTTSLCNSGISRRH